MEFDINPEWHTLITYNPPGLNPTMVGPNPNQSPDRYPSRMTVTSLRSTDRFPVR